MSICVLFCIGLFVCMYVFMYTCVCICVCVCVCVCTLYVMYYWCVCNVQCTYRVHGMLFSRAQHMLLAGMVDWWSTGWVYHAIQYKKPAIFAVEGTYNKYPGSARGTNLTSKISASSSPDLAHVMLFITCALCTGSLICLVNSLAEHARLLPYRCVCLALTAVWCL